MSIHSCGPWCDVPGVHDWIKYGGLERASSWREVAEEMEGQMQVLPAMYRALITAEAVYNKKEGE